MFHPILEKCNDYSLLKNRLTLVELNYAEEICNRCETATLNESGDYSCGCKGRGIEDNWDAGNNCKARRWLDSMSNTEEFIEYIREICSENN